MNNNTKAIIKGLIQEMIEQAYMPDYQAQKTQADGLGLILSRSLEWDGLEILKACYVALEDSNFHTENRTIQEMIEKLEGKRNQGGKVL